MHTEIHSTLSELAKVISGKEHVMQKILMAILADGHILLDDMPGMGKTTLAVALGKVTGLTAKRIQLTPDVLPSDVVGYSVYDKTAGQMEYRPGVVIGTNLLLADEINRTSSKTQSAFLEAMEERQVTVDGVTHPLENPFVVIATQNQVGTAGTQLLPYAQLDRFMAGLCMGYPDRTAQMELLKRRQNADPMDTLCQTITLQRMQTMRQEVQAVLAKDSILEYITELTIASRENAMIQVGLNPRAALHLDRMAKASGYASASEMLEAQEAFERESTREKLIQAGTPEVIADDYIERKYGAASRNSEPTEAPKEAEPTTEPTEKQEPPARDLGAEVRELWNLRPELRGKALPTEVAAAASKGRNLVRAYLDFESKQQRAEADNLRKELEILKQNAASAAKAPVKGVSGGGATDTKPEDPFLAGFDKGY